MNYQRIYNSIIERSRLRSLPSTTYIEVHHVIPRCAGGTDDADNLVRLTAEEHYVAHQLLIKIYDRDPKLVYAAKMMTISKGGNRSNNKLYGWIRREFSSAIGKRLTGKRWFHNPSTGETLVTLQGDPDPSKDSGFVRGRGFSPTKGMKFKKNRRIHPGSYRDQSRIFR